MPNPSYNIEDVYKEFATIDGYFDEDEDDGTQTKVNNEAIHDYCYYEDRQKKDKCNDYYEMTSSGVIYLLENLKKKCNLDDDKLAEYAILWLSYKLKIKENPIIKKLSVFYDSYIKTNEYYNKNINGDNLTYKEIIDKKKDLMDMDINEIFKLEAPFNILYYLYHEISDKHSDCDTNSNYANSFVNQFNDLNNDPNNKENSSYNKLLSILSDDYNNLQKKCTNFPSLPVYPRSFSIKVTLIPITFIFVAIPIFLEFAYK
ncbi:CIR protein, partial [Plasmodium chabaudi adami]